MKKPLVSVTSAFYNTGISMLDMIKSVFAQTYSQWELILLDDGSTDNSLEIARSIVDPRVKVFTNGQNMGRSYSLNRLTELSNGKYIARMDSDDLCSPARLEKQVQFMESHPDVDVVSTGICYLDEKDRPIGHSHSCETHEHICQYPGRGIKICHGAILGKKKWFEQNKYNETIKYAVDFDILLRSYEHSAFANISEPLYYYKLSLSFNLKKQFIARRNSANVLAKHFMTKKDYTKMVWIWFSQWVKFSFVLLCFLTGSTDRFIARRYKKLTVDEIDFYQTEIHAIRNTLLPGKITP
jgi:glycosyltransferase involved in cell wall biosynthesis